MIRCRSCSSSGAASLSRRSGWPTSTICSSFDFSVSRFDSMRSSSRAGEGEVLRLVDDEQNQPAREPLIDQELREIAKHDGLAHPARIEAEIEHDRLEQLPRLEHRIDDPSDSRLRVRPRSSVCSSVVLPDPISPVMTTNPA